MAVEKDDGENELSGCWCVLCSFLLSLSDFNKAVMNKYPRFLSPIMMHKTIYMVEFLLLSFICAWFAFAHAFEKRMFFARSLARLTLSLSLSLSVLFSKQVRQSCSTFLTVNSSRQNYER